MLSLRRRIIHSRNLVSSLCAATLAVLFVIDQAGAASVKIVALGASNTYGKGVGSSVAWPAKLEAMLRAKGYDVTVANEGVNGDTTSGMLRRLRIAVPGGTRLVILDKAASNDRKANAVVDTAANVQAIAAQLKARGIKLIVIPGMHGWANFQIQADGIHITEQGHNAVAAHLLPFVIGAIRKV
jgi:acyl-CoA thioesterase I